MGRKALSTEEKQKKLQEKNQKRFLNSDARERKRKTDRITKRQKRQEALHHPDPLAGLADAATQRELQDRTEEEESLDGQSHVIKRDQSPTCKGGETGAFEVDDGLILSHQEIGHRGDVDENSDNDDHADDDRADDDHDDDDRDDDGHDDDPIPSKNERLIINLVSGKNAISRVSIYFFHLLKAYSIRGGG